MKLHTDGTIEGTPEEISAFLKIDTRKVFIPLDPNNPYTSIKSPTSAQTTQTLAGVRAQQVDARMVSGV